jgi:hypothetical protein
MSLQFLKAGGSIDESLYLLASVIPTLSNAGTTSSKTLISNITTPNYTTKGLIADK